MKRIVTGLLLLLLTGAAVPSVARADETVSDWKGNKITLQEGDVDSHGVKIHYYTVGEGPVLIISHGNGDYWFAWRNQLAMLSKRYKVVLYDLRGFNKSDHPTGMENNVNAKYEQDLLAVQEHFTKGPAVHIGHDQGGMVLWGYAMNYPDKVRLLVEFNAIHPRAFVRELAFNPEQQKGSWYIRQFQENPAKGIEFEKSVMDPKSPRLAGNSPEILKMWAEAYARSTDKGAEATAQWYASNFPTYPYSPDAKAFGHHGTDFPMIKCPTLVIEGTATENFKIPGAPELKAGDAPPRALSLGGFNEVGSFIDAEATLVTLPKGTHFGQTSQPEMTNPVIATWLNAKDPMPMKLSER